MTTQPNHKLILAATRSIDALLGDPLTTADEYADLEQALETLRRNHSMTLCLGCDLDIFEPERYCERCADAMTHDGERFKPTLNDWE